MVFIKNGVVNSFFIHLHYFTLDKYWTSDKIIIGGLQYGKTKRNFT